MEKRIIFRIVFDGITLKDAAELEVKLEEVLEEYGEHRLEISAISPPVRPPRVS